MTFPGIKDPQARQDMIAYLKAVDEKKAPSAAKGMGGMQGDRASIIFAAPDEISRFIRPSCP
jgi:hypothetical protein